MDAGSIPAESSMIIRVAKAFPLSYCSPAPLCQGGYYEVDLGIPGFRAALQVGWALHLPEAPPGVIPAVVTYAPPKPKAPPASAQSGWARLEDSPF